MREYPKRIYHERKLLRYKSNFMGRISDILLHNNIKIYAS